MNLGNIKKREKEQVVEKYIHYHYSYTESKTGQANIMLFIIKYSYGETIKQSEGMTERKRRRSPSGGKGGGQDQIGDRVLVMIFFYLSLIQVFILL